MNGAQLKAVCVEAGMVSAPGSLVHMMPFADLAVGTTSRRDSAHARTFPRVRLLS